jgi:pimeloyl-ACP methyl ester carboxylesterase
MSSSQRCVAANGIALHIAEQGQGSLVLLLHGFPASRFYYRPIWLRRSNREEIYSRQ